MSDGQVGGNGSVHWLVNADDASAIKNAPNGRKWRQSGVDYHNGGELGTDFKIRIKLPQPRAARIAFLEALRDTVNAALANDETARLEFTLEIEQAETPSTQVQICWGDDPGWYEGLNQIRPTAEEKKVRPRAESV